MPLFTYYHLFGNPYGERWKLNQGADIPLHFCQSPAFHAKRIWVVPIILYLAFPVPPKGNLPEARASKIISLHRSCPCTSHYSHPPMANSHQTIYTELFFPKCSTLQRQDWHPTTYGYKLPTSPQLSLQRLLDLTMATWSGQFGELHWAPLWA